MSWCSVVRKHNFLSGYKRNVFQRSINLFCKHFHKYCHQYQWYKSGTNQGKKNTNYTSKGETANQLMKFQDHYLSCYRHVIIFRFFTSCCFINKYNAMFKLSLMESHTKKVSLNFIATVESQLIGHYLKLMFIYCYFVKLLDVHNCCSNAYV